MQVCKPNFVPGKSRAAIIYLVPPLLKESSGLPEGIKSEQLFLPVGSALLLNLAPGGAYLDPPKRTPNRDLLHYCRSGRLLPCLFTLTRHCRAVYFCGALRSL